MREKMRGGESMREGEKGEKEGRGRKEKEEGRRGGSGNDEEGEERREEKSMVRSRTAWFGVSRPQRSHRLAQLRPSSSPLLILQIPFLSRRVFSLFISQISKCSLFKNI